MRANVPELTVLFAPTAAESMLPLPDKETVSPETRFVRLRIDPLTVVDPSYIFDPVTLTES